MLQGGVPPLLCPACPHSCVRAQRVGSASKPGALGAFIRDVCGGAEEPEKPAALTVRRQGWAQLTCCEPRRLSAMRIPCPLLTQHVMSLPSCSLFPTICTQYHKGTGPDSRNQHPYEPRCVKTGARVGAASAVSGPYEAPP